MFNNVTFCTPTTPFIYWSIRFICSLSNYPDTSKSFSFAVRFTLKHTQRHWYMLQNTKLHFTHLTKLRASIFLTKCQMDTFRWMCLEILTRNCEKKTFRFSNTVRWSKKMASIDHRVCCVPFGHSTLLFLRLFFTAFIVNLILFSAIDFKFLIYTYGRKTICLLAGPLKIFCTPATSSFM